MRTLKKSTTGEVMVLVKTLAGSVFGMLLAGFFLSRSVGTVSTQGNFPAHLTLGILGTLLFCLAVDRVLNVFNIYRRSRAPEQSSAD